jgi:hypothetical protein
MRYAANGTVVGVAAGAEPPDGADEFAEAGGFVRLFVRPWVGRLLAATKRSPEPIRRILWGVRPER